MPYTYREDTDKKDQVRAFLDEGSMPLMNEEDNPAIIATTAAAVGARSRDQTSSSFVSQSQPGGFLHTPLCGLAPSRSGFPTRDYLGKRLKPLGPDLIRVGR
jgi:hypothetical protein